MAAADSRTVATPLRLVLAVAALGAVVAAAAIGMSLGGRSEKAKVNALEAQAQAAAKAQTAAKAQAQALANVRTALISMEAWQQDHGTYRGATLKGLHRYDYGVRDIRFVREARTSYCIESRVGNAVASVNGPAGKVRPAPCGA